MSQTVPNKLRERVVRAAEEALQQAKEVGPLEVLQRMGFLSPVHVDAWRQGLEWCRTLEPMIQAGPEKLERTYRYFNEWVQERGLRPVEAEYHRLGARSSQPLQVTEDGDATWEAFFRTHYVSADLPARRAKAVEKKLQKSPDLVIFQMVSDEAKCLECGSELVRGQCFCLEKGEPICLHCADLDHLVILPSGDAALSRRARASSPLSAVVLRFSRARKRYERQGVAVTPEALAAAEEACLADEDERARRRERAAILREAHDAEFVAELSRAILARYPRCPPDEAKRIAEHTGLRGSGRVGRSAAGRGLDASAIDLAVAASVRHAHTNYDKLLMSGVDRVTARQQVRKKIDEVLDSWR